MGNDTLDIILERGGEAAVVGLGASGMAALRLLRRQGMGLRACDNRPRERFPRREMQWLRERGIRVQFGAHGDDFLNGCDLVVLSPGVDQRQDVFRDLGRAGSLVIGELELAGSLVRTPTVAVTGTNGKSTVGKLVSEIFSNAGKRIFSAAIMVLRFPPTCVIRAIVTGWCWRSRAFNWIPPPVSGPISG